MASACMFCHEKFESEEEYNEHTAACREKNSPAPELPMSPVMQPGVRILETLDRPMTALDQDFWKGLVKEIIAQELPVLIAEGIDALKAALSGDVSNKLLDVHTRLSALESAVATASDTLVTDSLNPPPPPLPTGEP